MPHDFLEVRAPLTEKILVLGCYLWHHFREPTSVSFLRRVKSFAEYTSQDLCRALKKLEKDELMAKTRKGSWQPRGRKYLERGSSYHYKPTYSQDWPNILRVRYRGIPKDRIFDMNAHFEIGMQQVMGQVARLREALQHAA